MVLPRYSLSKRTLSTIHDLTRNKDNANQARSVLKNSVITSEKRVRVLEQIWFTKDCIKHRVTTNRIENVVKNLNLKPTQAAKLTKTLMSNGAKELQKKLRLMNAEYRHIRSNLESFLSEEERKLFENIQKAEVDHAKLKTKQHFKQRMDWINKRKERRATMETPDKIDGINISDQILDDTFKPKIREYGGVNLQEQEKELMVLPPKYAIYEKPNMLKFKANVEKTMNRIRWNREIERRKEEDKNRDEREDANNRANHTMSFYDDESKSFSGPSLSNIELPFKKRVGIPEYADAPTEARITLCRTEMDQVIQKHMNERKPKEKNLTRNQAIGMKSLKEKVKNKEIVCFPSDKSGVMTVDTPENYIESMAPHLEGTVPVTEEDYAVSEKLLNAHMQAWCRIMSFSKRITGDFQAENNEIQLLYGLQKDHKEIPAGEEVKGLNDIENLSNCIAGSMDH